MNAACGASVGPGRGPWHVLWGSKSRKLASNHGIRFRPPRAKLANGNPQTIVRIFEFSIFEFSRYPPDLRSVFHCKPTPPSPPAREATTTITTITSKRVSRVLLLLLLSPKLFSKTHQHQHQLQALRTALSSAVESHG